MLNPDYKDILQSLSNEKANFMLVGAYALAKHGYVRATGDIDIFVEPSLQNSLKVYKALQTFGAPLNAIQENTFAQSGIIFQIGVVPRRIDIITEIDGVDFAQCWQNREIAMFGDLEIPIIGLEDLIKNKSATNRKKDQADVEWLIDHHKKSKV